MSLNFASQSKQFINKFLFLYFHVDYISSTMSESKFHFFFFLTYLIHVVFYQILRRRIFANNVFQIL